MKLRKLSVNQFKCFTVPTQLGELGDGLNLVVGPNELGKSTLLDALRAVLFERYSSGAGPIRALQNDRSGAAPVVELVFQVNGAEYTLTKRFVKSPLARLQCPDGTLLEADAAENKLRNLLGFSEAGNRGATSETLGMWGVLWVQQGQSFGRPHLPHSALASLSAGLESEVGTVLGGRRGRELPQVIEQQRGEFVTAAQRRPRGVYKETLDNVSDLEKRLSEQQQQQKVMSQTLEQLAETAGRLKRLEEGSQDRIDQEERKEAQDQLDEVMRHDLQLEVARSELQNRQGQLEQAERAQSERGSRRAELKTDQDQLRQETERLKELQEHERESLASLGCVDILVMMLVCQMLSCQQNNGTGFSISCVAAPACMSLRKKIASDLSRLCCGLTAPAPNGGCFRPNTGIGTVSINDSPVGLTKASGNRCFNISPATRTWNT